MGGEVPTAPSLEKLYVPFYAIWRVSHGSFCLLFWGGGFKHLLNFLKLFLDRVSMVQFM